MRVADLIRSMEGMPVGDGDLLGEPFESMPFQRRFLRGAFRDGVIRAGCSLARGGGKTGMASQICLDGLRPSGALHRPGYEIVLVASSFSQARIAFEAVKTSLELMKVDDEYRIRDQQNLADIQHLASRARLRVVGCDSRRAHGWRFDLCIADEPAQWGPSGEKLAVAIRTTLGKRRGARALFIGTRPASDDHFFARLLAETDRSVYAQVHTASTEDNPFHRRTWHKANPGLRFGLPDVAVLAAEARLAKKDPGELATFRSLRLNMGLDEIATPMLLDASTWQSVEVDVLPPREGPFALGIDLGGTAAFSAAAAFWPKTGRLEGFVSCGSDPPLTERAKGDGLPGVYERMRSAGELVLLGGRIVPVDQFLEECVRRYGRPSAICADRFRQGEMTDGARATGLRLPEPTWRGQGWFHGGVDVRAFRQAVLSGRVVPPVSLAMRSAFTEARVTTDNAGNSKLAKGSENTRRRRGRDDLCAAIILAVSEGLRRHNKQPTRRPLRYESVG